MTNSIEKRLANDIMLVDDISFVRIMVVKKKFVEQIETWWITKEIPWKETSFIGTIAQHTVIFKVGDSKLWQIHIQEFKEKLRNKYVFGVEKPNYKEIDFEVDRICKGLPQLFVE